MSTSAGPSTHQNNKPGTNSNAKSVPASSKRMWTGMVLSILFLIVLLFDALLGTPFLDNSATSDFQALVWRPLVGAALVVFICTLVMWSGLNRPRFLLDLGVKGFNLGVKMGVPSWDFGTSWASTLTLVGGLLTTVLAAGVLPSDSNGKTLAVLAPYALAALFFVALTLLAPLVYNVCRNYNAEHKQIEGFVGFYLAASIVTLWAVLSELVTLATLARIIANGLNGIKPSEPIPSIANLLCWASLLACPLVLAYVWTSLRGTVEAQIAADQPKKPVSPQEPAFVIAYIDHVNLRAAQRRAQAAGKPLEAIPRLAYPLTPLLERRLDTVDMQLNSDEADWEQALAHNRIPDELQPIVARYQQPEPAPQRTWSLL